ncbi:MAG: hypothetical protein H6736_13220 [Alphaproteobacteria bacterium]|nr:hypothetical protein [Alphaproteobacteria bacterium]MCB9692764.1 hypothetical protein [Alphaproteobacteria bacterium]
MDGNLVIGGLLVLVGMITLVGRLVAPESAMFAKLGPMKAQYGDRAGTALHVLSYTVMPLVVGATLLATALRG